MSVSTCARCSPRTAHPTSLDLCAHFFDEGFAHVVGDGRDDSDKAWLVSEASLTLLLLGRPALAVPLIRANVARFEALGEHGNVSYSYENLVDALTLLGRLDEALDEARRGLARARTVAGDYFREVILMCHLAFIQRLRGETREVHGLYERAEKIQLVERKRRLTSAIGYRYTALLLDLATSRPEWEEALARADFARAWSRRQDNPADAGRDGINVARALDALGRTDEARAAIDEAVAVLRSAHRADYLAEALLARAELLAHAPADQVIDVALREDDLACCTELIELGELRCLRCDLVLLRAKLAQQRGDITGALELLAHATGLATQCGLRARENEMRRLAAACDRANPRRSP